jgi:glutamyl-tRNA(Gln) amidotransferase subunit D
MLEGYSPEIRAALEKIHAEVGHKIAVIRNTERYEGLLMPKAAGDPNTIVIKLDNGYNIGIAYEPGVRLERLHMEREVKELRKAPEVVVSAPRATHVKAERRDPAKPTIAILHTGGTIASRVDYRTGAVTSLVTEEELLAAFPELKEIANIRSRLVFRMLSEDMEPAHWVTLAREVHEELTEEHCDGIIITHGTDTMHYTAAALALMLHNLPVPVLLVGSQRSSDRGSSDAGMNLICAANFIANSDWSGVGICMHATPSDDYCWILPPCKTRKMHTSRRDTFRPINAKPIAKVDYSRGQIEIYQKDYPPRDLARIPRLENRFEPAVALIKIRPGFRAEELDWYGANCKGIVLEGTGLGHAPINKTDETTSRHPELLRKLTELTSKGILVYMTSQCPYGRVNLHVYSTGRELLKAGVRPAYMLPEVAFVKLGWVLGHTRDPAEVRRMMETDFAGEIIERSEIDEFPDKGMES